MRAYATSDTVLSPHVTSVRGSYVEIPGEKQPFRSRLNLREMLRVVTRTIGSFDISRQIYG